jgi:hypothetical protein
MQVTTNLKGMPYVYYRIESMCDLSAVIGKGDIMDEVIEILLNIK